MVKISKKEYEILKSLDDRWKWIARDGKSLYGSIYSNRVMAYQKRPKKRKGSIIWSNGSGGEHLTEELFQFIRWEDEEPYSIAELIEEYEVEELRCSYFGPRFPKVNGFYNANLATWVGLNESEETEMKSKQELIEKWESAIESAEFYGIGREDGLIEYMRVFVGDLNQLDEPEVLSQEWIDDHAKAVAYDGIPDQTEVVYVDDLQNLLAPKQEEVDRAYKDGYEKGKRHTFYKGYLEWFVDKESTNPERSPEVDQHKELLDELNDLYARKNQDYSNSFDESLDEDGLLVLKIRLGDKFKRFSQLINNEQMVNDESMRDTLIDLANYTLMGVMWMDKKGE